MLLGQNTKQPLSNFETKNLRHISNFESSDLTLVAYKKNVSVKSKLKSACLDNFKINFKNEKEFRIQSIETHCIVIGPFTK